ncbi:MAG: VCBS repeat-containing protein [Candidatus Midichloria mitochondrii]|uniref:FG-GAP repeat domain-containing protein n=1 Tax=Candidatus Midichloria mitochondrii TaxID=234827 RepID=UPI00135F1392|nr:VCBS repeat-containing protein [Candidatus Midichloria mitochondrii]MDJ1312651.1 VCBS repeat-containing protein [Candidatus Midichloria mitochondrii]MDJ1583178.1 VCBS repeat-containing protein [Candidatus Midichloria mitochondrii]
MPIQTRVIQPAVSYTVGSEAPLIIAVADFNLDGKLDLVNSNYNGNSVSALLGKGDGTFHAAVLYSVGGGYTWGVTATDFTMVNGHFQTSCFL